MLAAILRAQPHQEPGLPVLAGRLLRATIPADDPWTDPPLLTYALQEMCVAVGPRGV